MDNDDHFIPPINDQRRTRLNIISNSVRLFYNHEKYAILDKYHNKCDTKIMNHSSLFKEIYFNKLAYLFELKKDCVRLNEEIHLSQHSRFALTSKNFNIRGFFLQVSDNYQYESIIIYSEIIKKKKESKNPYWLFDITEQEKEYKPIISINIDTDKLNIVSIKSQDYYEIILDKIIPLQFIKNIGLSLEVKYSGSIVQPIILFDEFVLRDSQGLDELNYNDYFHNPYKEKNE